MISLNQHHRTAFADHILELGNLAVAALVFGQIVANAINWFFVGLAGIILCMTYIVSYRLLRLKY